MALLPNDDQKDIKLLSVSLFRISSQIRGVMYRSLHIKANNIIHMKSSQGNDIKVYVFISLIF